MNKILKSTLAAVLAGVIALSAASCAKQTKTQLDVEKFPLVYADENGLEAINEGEDDGWQETDMAFYRFEPSLTALLEEFVEANKDVIFD